MPIPFLLKLSRSIDLLHEEVRRGASSISGVRKVRRSQDERTLADLVTDVAENLGPVGREVGNLLVVLLVTRVTEEHGSLDLLTDRSVQVRDSRRDERRTLAGEM